MRRQLVWLSAWILFAGLTGSTVSARASKTTQHAPEDRIDVLGHFPLTNGPIKQLVPAQHYSRYYLYAGRENGKTVAVIDVTDAKVPSLVADVSYPVSASSDALLAISGTVALVGTPAPAAAEEAPLVVRIMNFADPLHPIVVREFAGVTAIGRDAGRGLVFLADPEGIWILQQRPAGDPAVDNAYAQSVLYNH